MQSRITLIHATPLAIEPVQASFKRLWPTAKTVNLLEDSLSADLAEGACPPGHLTARFLALGRYAVMSGANAILFTCSAFGAAIDETKKITGVPTLKPNEAMFEEALEMAAERRGRIGLLTTFAPAAMAMAEELQAMAFERGQAIQIEQNCIPGAMVALKAANARLHDELLEASAAAFSHCDVLMLGQFSMARAYPAIESRLSIPVLTSPDSAVRRLKNVLGQK